MSVQGGPKAAALENLIIYYDIDNPHVYYEPTTNIAPDADYSNNAYDTELNASSWGGDEAKVYYYETGGFNNLAYKKLIKVSGGTGGSYRFDNENFEIFSGETYIVSCWMKSNRYGTFTSSKYNLAINRVDNHYELPADDIALTTEWQRIVWEFNPAFGEEGEYRTRCIIYEDTVSAENPLVIYWSGFQVEKKDHVTNFTNSNNLAGFAKDLTPNGFNANARTLTGFDSDGKLFFTSGSTSGVKISMYVDAAAEPSLTMGYESRTVEALVKLSSGDDATTRGVFTHSALGGSNGYGTSFHYTSSNWYLRGEIYGPSGGRQVEDFGQNIEIDQDIWQHCVWVFDRDHLKMIGYINGETTGYNTFTEPGDVTYTYSSANIGTTHYDYFRGMYGYMNYIKVYNKALSADEVKANYDMVKIARMT